MRHKALPLKKNTSIFLAYFFYIFKEKYVNKIQSNDNRGSLFYNNNNSRLDLFTRLNQKYIITDSLKYCQANKGLEIYAYCLMSSHLHLFCKATNGFILSDIIRDFKKFTSKKIIDEPESRIET